MARDEQSYTRTPPVVDGEHTLDRVETVLAAAARQVATELDASEPSRYGARDASARPRGNGTRDLRGDDAAKTTVCAAIFEETTLQQWCCDLREETTPKKRAETVSTFATRPRVRRDL